MSWVNMVRPHRLFPFLLFVCLSNALTAAPLRINGSTGVKPLVEALVAEYQSIRTGTDIQIGSGLKPKARIQALFNGQIDIAMASHGIDMTQIAEQGLKVHRFAKMAVVIGVNHTVAVESLTHQALCNIYGGKMKSWKHLSATDTPISAFIRPFNEVDTEVLSAHIPCFTPQRIAKGIYTKKKSGQMARALANTPGAIGMTTLVAVAQSNGKIRALALDGVKPDPTRLLSGAYPLTRDSFLITAVKPSPKVAAFLTFIRSEEGKGVIIANNAVPAG